ncbi:Splicing factor 3B subunit 3 [Camelus dromedarius]|uniref:Splicing factor 3B subunit 3 n=5 Tax=Laurasiatheria TaxID=314145 RepID=A0A5N4DSN5_CAMDR|nr:Splicing factor 3B subunit 3 [Camelus dromedarius]
MFLYNLTLQRATGISFAIHGNFSGTKQQEIVVSRGKILELLRPDPNTGKVHTLLTVEVFGVIRSLMAFRLTGGTKDYIVVGSDSGRIVILEYQPSKNMFEKIHQETFGKSGCRRIVPGQFLAVDPKGRAVMISAIEKQKLVYILNRDAAARLTISSPLEAHKANTLVYHVVGVDVGFENPMFACLEMDYEEADNDPTGEAAANTQQTLTFYELDLGLNHVVRKYSEPLEEHGNFLITGEIHSIKTAKELESMEFYSMSEERELKDDNLDSVLVCWSIVVFFKVENPGDRVVPGGSDGPSGVLICSENYITYKNFGDQPDIRCPIPRRRNDLDDPERGMIFVCSATHKTKSMFFFLAQTEQGDIFKITLETDEDMVTEIRLKYFDTVPVAAAMCVLKTGFLFVASEFGNQTLTEIADLANEDTPQLYVACGRGPRSSLRVLRHGLEVSEMAVSELPGNPNAVWTVRRHIEGIGIQSEFNKKKKVNRKLVAVKVLITTDEFDAYIIVSFVNATLVLSIGETVEEVTDSGFLGTTPTLSCSLLGDDALVQVYPDGIRHIRADKRVNEWKTPGKKTIVKCAVNQRQVVIALTGGELVYFEMDPSGQLNEYTERKEMSADVVCMSLANVPPGEQRSRFLAVGLVDNTVRIISLDPSDCLQPLSMQALPAQPESLCIVEMGGTEKQDELGERGSIGFLYLNIGLQNGVLLRTVLDPVTGDLSDTRTRYLGSRPVKLFRVRMQGQEAVLAMSSRSWLSYSYQSRFHLTPLSYETLEFASGFASEQCPEGIVAISTNTLRILALEKLGAVFNQVAFPLQYTPRKFVIHPESNNLIIIETDHNAYTEATKAQRKQQMAEEMVEAAGEDERELAAEMAAAFLNENLPESIFGAPKAGNGQWASVIRVMNPIQGNTLDLVQLEQNEAAFSVAVCRFSNTGDDWYVLVGVAKDLILNPRSVAGGFVYTYKLVNNGEKLEFLHKTPVEEVPAAIAPFQGRVLIGVGKLLRVYDLGKKKLLRKCENKHIANYISGIQTIGHRVIVSDVQESFIWVRYKRNENQLIIFADDTYPRWVTTASLLDYDTVAGADKFGNICVVRLPPNTNDEVDEDPTGNKALWDRGLLNGASQKAEVIMNYHVGETVLSLQKTTLIPGGSESLVYTTLSGGIGILVPFTSHEDHDFFQHVEMHLRSEHPPLCGRDHLSFRSYYFPVKNVIDGDLCEQFNSMEPNKQKNVSEELDRTPPEVSKKLEDIRTRYAF